MGTPQHNADQRRSFRCPVGPSRKDSELAVGAASIPVCLVDESAGGFAVDTLVPPGVKVDDVARLCTVAGWFEVRVAYVSKVVMPAGEEKGGVLAFRIGLQRLREIDPPDDEEEPARPQVRFPLAGLFPLRSSFWVTGTVVAMAIVTAIVGALAVARHSDHPLARKTTRWLDRHVFHMPDPTDNSHWPDPPQDPLVTETDSGQPFFQGSVGRSRAGFGHAFQHLQDDLTAVLPQIAEPLGLSSSQQDSIRQVVGSTARQLQDLETAATGLTRPEAARKRAEILEQAERQTLDVLTGEQRQRWRALIGETDGNTR